MTERIDLPDAYNQKRYMQGDYITEIVQQPTDVETPTAVENDQPPVREELGDNPTERVNDESTESTPIGETQIGEIQEDGLPVTDNPLSGGNVYGDAVEGVESEDGSVVNGEANKPTPLQEEAADNPNETEYKAILSREEPDNAYEAITDEDNGLEPFRG